jgi:putative transposase
MKRVRITYEGAFHHVMNRGINDEDIFCPGKCKTHFLDYLETYSRKLKIRIFAYCIMDNHYHLVLENSSLNSLPKLYQDAKKRQEAGEESVQKK